MVSPSPDTLTRTLPPAVGCGFVQLKTLAARAAGERLDQELAASVADVKQSAAASDQLRTEFSAAVDRATKAEAEAKALHAKAAANAVFLPMIQSLILSGIGGSRLSRVGMQAEQDATRAAGVQQAATAERALATAAQSEADNERLSVQVLFLLRLSKRER